VVDILNTKIVLYDTLRDVLMIDWVSSVFLNHVYLSNHISWSQTTVDDNKASQCRKVNLDFDKIETTETFEHFGS